MANFLKKRSVSLPLVINAGVSSLILALGMTPTFSSFTASISSNGNNASSGTIVMQEKNSTGTVTCTSTDGGGITLDAASCSTMNKYGGGDMRPGDSAAVLTYIADVGTVGASSFSLTPGSCVESADGSVAGSATDFCSKIGVSITSGSNTIFTGTAATLGSAGTIDVLAHLGLPRVQVGVPILVTVTTSIDATVGNAYQGLTVSQPLTWTFTA